MRKITNGPHLVCLGLAIAGILFFWFSRDVVAEGQAGDEEHSWGYRVSRYQFRRSGAQIEIWNSRGLRLTYFEPETVIWAVKQEHWLSDRRAIYLDLDLGVKEDTTTNPFRTEFLYDYRRGEVHVSSEANLWREGDPPSYADRDPVWMTNEEFKSILASYARNSTDRSSQRPASAR